MNAYPQSPAPPQPAIKTLPLSLTTFTAQLFNKAVRLSWSTDMALNSSHFVVLRSSDGSSFDEVGLVFTDGERQNNSHKAYNFSDNIEGINSRILFYRLKMVDLDGKYSYSEMLQIRVVNDIEASLVTAYPNPARNEIRVTVPSAWQNKQISYNIYNMEGVHMGERIMVRASQTETFPIADLPSGNYLIRITNGNQTAVEKFIKAQ
ncbi:MAG: T9SS type A sorting domain-containing protein [Chitinophagales bacterium]